MVHTLNNNVYFTSPINFIFNDCLKLIKHFKQLRVVYVCCDANQVAHLLVRAVNFLTNRKTWYSYSSLIRAIISSD